MGHYNDIYDPLVEYLGKDDQDFRLRAFAFMESFMDVSFTNVTVTPEKRESAKQFLSDPDMMRHYESEEYKYWEYKEHPEEGWGIPNTSPWWAEGTSYAGTEDVFPRHFRECISSLLPELRIALYEKFRAEYKS